MGTNRPVFIVEVELRIDLDEIHVGLVVGVDGAHVAPVGLSLTVFVAEGKDVHGMRVNDPGKQIVAKVVAALAVAGVGAELFEKKIGTEAVDTHRSEAHAGAAGQRRRICDLLVKLSHSR